MIKKILSGILGTYLAFAPMVSNAGGEVKTSNPITKPVAALPVKKAKKKEAALPVKKEKAPAKRAPSVPKKVVPKAPKAGKVPKKAIAIKCNPPYKGVEFKEYKVQKGDKLWKIARKEGLKKTKDIYDFVCKTIDKNGIDKYGGILPGQKIMIPGKAEKKESKLEKKLVPAFTKEQKEAIVDEIRNQRSVVGLLGYGSLLEETFAHLGGGYHTKDGKLFMLSGAVGSKDNLSLAGPISDFAATAPGTGGLHKEILTDVDIRTKIKGAIYGSVGRDFGRYFTGVGSVGAQFLEDTYHITTTNRTMNGTTEVGRESKTVSGKDSTVRGVLGVGLHYSLGALNPKFTNAHLVGKAMIPFQTETEYDGFKHKFNSGLNGADYFLGFSYRFGETSAQAVMDKYEPAGTREVTVREPGYNAGVKKNKDLEYQRKRAKQTADRQLERMTRKHTNRINRERASRKARDALKRSKK